MYFVLFSHYKLTANVDVAVNKVNMVLMCPPFVLLIFGILIPYILEFHKSQDRCMFW